MERIEIRALSQNYFLRPLKQLSIKGGFVSADGNVSVTFGVMKEQMGTMEGVIKKIESFLRDEPTNEKEVKESIMILERHLIPPVRVVGPKKLVDLKMA